MLSELKQPALKRAYSSCSSEWEKDSGLPAGEQTARRLHFGKVLRAVAEEMNRMSASQATAVAAAPFAFSPWLVEQLPLMRERGAV